jgi:hypothetical protein
MTRLRPYIVGPRRGLERSRWVLKRLSLIDVGERYQLAALEHAMMFWNVGWKMGNFESRNSPGI